MNGLVSFFINIFSGLSKEAVVFIISLLPILELRGGMLAATLLKVSYIKALLICVVGNILPIPFVLLFLNFIFELMKKWHFSRKIVIWLEKKANSKKSQIEKYGYWGLILFVGIPLPGTGAWTGALIAVILGLNKKKSFLCILLGVLLASLVMSVLSYGVLGNLIN